MTEDEKIALKARCESLINSNENRRSVHLSGKNVLNLLKKINLQDLLPSLTKKGAAYRISKGKGIHKIYTMYLKFLIEESLKYPISIYIPYIGMLEIFETDSVGKKSMWKEDGEFKVRMDTVFDQKVKYWMSSFIFGFEQKDFATTFHLRRRYVKPILYKVYQAHPDGGFYEDRKTKK